MSETAAAIVIPVRNEASFLSPALERITRQMESLGVGFRLFLVENGSADDTYRQAAARAGDDPRIRALRLPGADYGLAVRRGLEEAAASGGGWIFLFHLDRFSGEFVEYALNSAADVVAGSATRPQTPDGRSPFRCRALQWAAGAECGGRGAVALRASVAPSLLDRMEGEHDLLEAEMLIRAERSGYQIETAPAAVEELRPPRSSLLRLLRGALILRRSLRR